MALFVQFFKVQFLYIMKKIIFFLTLLVSCFIAKAQYDNSIPKVATVTPEAAALFKMAGRPEGSFSGTAPTSIALYEVKSGGLQVPVSINYSNGGIKVEEVASWVGLGWNLIAGGRITRAMNGVADDEPNKGMLYQTVKPSVFPNGDIVGNATYVVAGTMDVEPDLFYLDGNGISAKFAFNENYMTNGKIMMVDQQQLKITPIFISGHIKGWVVIDVEGNKYYFGLNKAQNTSAADVTAMSYDGTSAPGPTPSYVSSWHLMEIWDRTDDHVIRFNYVQTSTSFATLSGAQLGVGSWPTAQLSDCTTADYQSAEVYAINNTESFYLSKIVGAMDSLVFHSSTGRLDFNGGRKLDSLVYYQNNGAALKRHHFSYSYFVSPLFTPTNAWEDAFSHRLKLNGLTAFGTAANDSLTHRFEYEEMLLPSRISRAVDYWGYFNGVATNTTFMPSGRYQYGTYLHIVGGADRRANPYYSRANTLKKITYPTGGKREFEYEGNQILINAFDNQMTPDENQFSTTGFTETNFNFLSEFMPVAQKTFTINSFDESVMFNWQLTASNCHTGNMSVKIYKLDPVLPEQELMSWSGVYTGQFLLRNGNYRIEVYEGAGCELAALSADWRFRLSLPTTTAAETIYGKFFKANNNAGGIRVKRVSDYDPVRGIYHHTRYQYNLSTDTTLTSGLLVSPVRSIHFGGCPQPFRVCELFKLSSQSHYPLAAEGGSYVVYPQVRTFEDGNGYTDRTFHFEYDIEPTAIDIASFPIVPPRDNSWRRGRLRWEKKYNSQGQLLNEKFNEGHEIGIYSPGDSMETSQTGVKVVGYYCNDQGLNWMCSACSVHYNIYGQFNALRKQRDRTYDPSTGLYVDQYTEYDYYTNLNRTLLKEERTFLSNGEVKKTTYRYAFNDTGDFVFGLNATEQLNKSALLAEHYIKPLEISTTIGPVGGAATLVQGVKFSFGDFSGKLRLAAVREYRSAVDYQETLLTAYDQRGNIAEKQRPEGIKESYLWGYQKNYPVATITGSSLAELNGLYNQNFLDAPTSDAALRAHLTALRSALPNTKQMVGATYKPEVGVTSQIDSKGLTIYYGYDAFQRLRSITDHQGNIVKDYQYNYAQSIVYRNVAASQTFTKNNCGSGYTGGQLTYTVPANTYSSVVSQAAADALAAADIAANGQNYANANAGCTLIQSCTRFRITIPAYASDDLYITYRACGESSYSTRALMFLPNESWNPNEIMVDLCIQGMLEDFSFQYGLFGYPQSISGVTIQNLGACP